MPGRMGLTTTQRKAVLRNQASNLLWYGRIEVTEGHVRALRPYVEKIITLAVNSYEDTIETTVTSKDAKGKEITKKVLKPKSDITGKQEDFTTIIEEEEDAVAVWNVSNGLGIYKSFIDKDKAIECAEKINEMIFKNY